MNGEILNSYNTHTVILYPSKVSSIELQLDPSKLAPTLKWSDLQKPHSKLKLTNNAKKLLWFPNKKQDYPSLRLFMPVVMD